MKKTALIIFLLFTFYFSGCSLFYSTFFDEPEIIGYKNIRVSKIGFSGAELKVTVLVKNKNSIDAKILRCDYELFVNDTYIGKGNSVEKQILNARDTSEIIMPLTIKTSDLLPGALSIFKDIIKGEQMLYRIEGEVLGEAKGVELELPISIEKKISAEIF
jgi:LEA14-like dessication related protein